MLQTLFLKGCFSINFKLFTLVSIFTEYFFHTDLNLKLSEFGTFIFQSDQLKVKQNHS